MPAGDVPQALLNHELVQSAFDGLDRSKVWDCHTHLLGLGEGKRGYFGADEAATLCEIRRYNPLLFDCKRALRHRNQGLPEAVFETRRHFERHSGTRVT